ncbi:MAG TPA: class II fructose-bisphosphatase [Chloroflexi bacterium]|nr:class II fructose-bisphosphatase [Chloroflexota bacterium]HBY06836.1 class II fructose-bisphosphatase [Chloroflexota bacterium]
MESPISPNLGMALVRVTEAAALTAGRYMGLNKSDEADHYAAQAMADAFASIDIEGHVVIGEETKLGIHSPLDSGSVVGNGDGPEMDVVVDPVDGTRLLAMGHPDAIAVVGIAPRGSMWAPYPAVYMEKIVVDSEAADVLVPECMDAPAAWTLALIARAKKKKIRDLVVFILDRPRHYDLIDEIRAAGARVMARSQGDIAGALMAVSSNVNIDVMMGVGGISEGVISACAIKCMGGAMLGRLAPQTRDEHVAVQEANLDTQAILTCEELVRGCDIFFAATGITDGKLLSGVRYHGDWAESESMVLRCSTGTRRVIHAEHRLED